MTKQELKHLLKEDPEDIFGTEWFGIENELEEELKEDNPLSKKHETI